jgi:hypothetical protein
VPLANLDGHRFTPKRMQSRVVLLQPGPRGFRIGCIVGKLLCSDRRSAAAEHAQAGVRKHRAACYADFELQGLLTALNQFLLKSNIQSSEARAIAVSYVTFIAFQIVLFMPVGVSASLSMLD